MKLTQPQAISIIEQTAIFSQVVNVHIKTMTEAAHSHNAEKLTELTNELNQLVKNYGIAFDSLFKTYTGKGSPEIKAAFKLYKPKTKGKATLDDIAKEFHYSVNQVQCALFDYCDQAIKPILNMFEA